MVDPTGRIAIADDVLIGGAIVATGATIAYLQAPSPGDPNKTNAQAMADSSLEALDTVVDAMDSMDDAISDAIYDAFFADGDSAYAVASAKEMTPDRNKANDEAGRARDRDRENKQREKERKRFGPKDSTPADRGADSLPGDAPGEVNGDTPSPDETEFQNPGGA